MSYDGDDSYPHDGKQGRCGCGEGYSWTDDDGYHHGGGSSGNGCSGGLIFLIAVIIGSIIGAFNQLLGALVIIVVGIVLFVNM